MTLHSLLQQLRDGPTALNARTAQIQMVLPVLRELGWADTDPRQVKLDQPIGANEAAAADIILTIPRGERTAVWSEGEDRAAVLIAVDAHGADLESRAAELLPHAAHEDVDLFALTTGLTWRLYLPRRLGDGGDVRFAVLDLRGDSLDGLVDQLEAYLHRDALIGQSAQRAAEHALNSRLNAERLQVELPRVWRRLLSEPEPLILEIVQEEVHRTIGLRVSPEQVAELLRASGRRVALSEPPPAPPPPIRQLQEPSAAAPPQPKSPPQLLKPPPRRSPRVRASAPRPAAFQLWSVEYPFRSWKDLWLTVVAEVYERHPVDFERAEALRGSSRQYIARSTASQNKPERLGQSPWYVETKLRSDDCEQLARRLLELFGYGSDALMLVETDRPAPGAAGAQR